MATKKKQSLEAFKAGQGEEYAKLLAALGTNVTIGAPKRTYYHTGYADLDALLGGGLPRGGYVTLAGPPGSGKTTLALSVSLSLLRSQEFDGKLIVYVDADHAVTEDLLREVGFTDEDMGRFLLKRTAILEEAIQTVFNATSKVVGLVVVDTIESLVSKEEEKLSKNMGDTGSPAPIARLFSRKFGDLVQRLDKHGVAALFLKGVREKMNRNPYEFPYTEGKGGHAIRHGALAYLFQFQSVVKDKERTPVGQSVRHVVLRSKLSGCKPGNAAIFEYKRGYPMLLPGSLDSLMGGGGVLVEEQFSEEGRIAYERTLLEQFNTSHTQDGQVVEGTVEKE